MTSSNLDDRPDTRRGTRAHGQRTGWAVRLATGRLAIVLTVAVLVAGGVTATIAARQSGRVGGLLVQGIAADPCVPSRALPVPPDITGHFEAGSSVLRTPSGVLTAAGVRPLTGGTAQCVRTAVAASRQWLGDGLVPGTTQQQRSMASRALLDLRLSVRPNGAVVAGWQGEWRYAWPRDSSWVAVALADTGHPDLALRILRFLQRVQSPDGTWAARYHLGGAPVRDGRPAELDATGWVPWAVWSWAQAAAEHAASPAATGRVRRELTQLWPMVTAAANAADRSLTADGLPGPSMDYWEDSVQVTLSTTAALLAGLRAAADLAESMSVWSTAAGARLADVPAAGNRWAAAATGLAATLQHTFGHTGYLRAPSLTSGADAAVTFLGPPFAVPSLAVLQAERAAEGALRQPNGGLLPGAAWTGSLDVAWTAETAFFALFDAGTARPQDTDDLLTWLATHRTKLGELAEQVNANGRPVSVAPLAWTDAVVLLSMLAESGQLPTIPLPFGGSGTGAAAGAVAASGTAGTTGSAVMSDIGRPRKLADPGS